MAEKSHKHDWYVGGYIAPNEDEDDPPEGPPREHKVIFDCDCGETRHVPMTKDGIAKIHEAIDDPNADPGRIPPEDLVEAMPK